MTRDRDSPKRNSSCDCPYMFQQCLDANISVCEATQTLNESAIIIYNPLAQRRIAHIRVPVPNDKIQVCIRYGDIYQSFMHARSSIVCLFLTAHWSHVWMSNIGTISCTQRPVGGISTRFKFIGEKDYQSMPKLICRCWSTPDNVRCSGVCVFPAEM